MIEFLLDIKNEVDQARPHKDEPYSDNIGELEGGFDTIIAEGLELNPPPKKTRETGQGQTISSQNLLYRLKWHKPEVMEFMCGND